MNYCDTTHRFLLHCACFKCIFISTNVSYDVFQLNNLFNHMHVLKINESCLFFQFHAIKCDNLFPKQQKNDNLKQCNKLKRVCYVMSNIRSNACACRNKSMCDDFLGNNDVCCVE